MSDALHRYRPKTTVIEPNTHPRKERRFLKKERRKRHLPAFGPFPVLVAPTSTVQTQCSSSGVAAVNSHDR
jgi:hypothetical protein